jgi:ABC-type glycerol-3-phosphate transport system substrate-binding protein
MWALNDQTILKESVDAYNKDHPDEKITLRLFANDDYKQKLRVAFGANQAPDIFFSWGGGALDDYVKAGKVDALTAAEANTDRFTPSVMQSATFDGKVYGVPANGHGRRRRSAVASRDPAPMGGRIRTAPAVPRPGPGSPYPRPGVGAPPWTRC